MKSIKECKSGFTLIELVIVIAVIAILAAVLIPTFSNVITSAQITKHHSNAKNIYTEYLNNANDNLIDDLAIKLEEDIYVIYIDGKAIDGIFTYEEVREKFQYSLVKKYDQDDNILLVYDYDVNNPNSYSKISIDIKKETSFNSLLSYVKLRSDYSVEKYKSRVDEQYKAFIDCYKIIFDIDITDYINKEIYEEYVIYAVFINEYSNYNFNYSEFNVENELRYSIIATENGKREEHKNYVDFIFIPKFHVFDDLGYNDAPGYNAKITCEIKCVFKEETIEVKINCGIL